MKTNGTALATWLAKTTLKQRIVLGLGGFLMVVMIGLGIYTLVPQDKQTQQTTSNEKTVTVQDINTEKATKAVTDTPAESKVVEAQVVTNDNSTVVESNVTTVETPQIESEPVYTSEETGGRYEAPQETYEEPVYEEPVYEEPAYTEPVAESGGGWDGDFAGADADSTGNAWGDGSGTGISN
jgi:cytoskeletal protein RodZ